ncbi:hypothetical protein ZIOFF_038346 [Zingiber officinale]|uniref:Uncharacterized protein n=1 Tax=Zingiber officinale TaxID=94328 RepID=A0A8J5L2Q2_ZINOF|nr:hypothetical protein ZIOFF_038346 [Zingiber officinale]
MVAASASFVVVLLLLLFTFASPAACFPRLDDGGADRGDRFSILNLESLWHDYAPPSPPPSPPDPPSASCEGDLGGTGDFDGLCEVHTSVQLSEDIFVKANGSFVVYPDVVLSCPLAGCSLVVNLTGEIRIGRNAKIVAGLVRLGAGNMSLADGAAIDTTALAGDPPPQTSGVPSGVNGDGGGHGGRGASCVVKEGQTQEDSWGGDAYSWSYLTRPESYGSKGGSTSREKDYGGGGGGQVFFIVKDFLEVNGSILADGGEGGSLGGGGSGGSIYINATKMKGTGMVSASGGSGLAGGGGGRVSIAVFSWHDEPHVFVHGFIGFRKPPNQQLGRLFCRCRDLPCWAGSGNVTTVVGQMTSDPIATGGRRWAWGCQYEVGHVRQPIGEKVCMWDETLLRHGGEEVAIYGMHLLVVVKQTRKKPSCYPPLSACDRKLNMEMGV